MMVFGIYTIFMIAAVALGIYVTILIIKALNIYIKKNLEYNKTHIG